MACRMVIFLTMNIMESDSFYVDSWLDGQEISHFYGKLVACSVNTDKFQDEKIPLGSASFHAAAENRKKNGISRKFLLNEETAV
jgi:hypothetical protein